jgi:hypothetical protein
VPRCARSVAHCTADPLGIQQCVQRLLHAPSNHAVEVVLDPLIVNRDDVPQRTQCGLGRGGSFLLSWLPLSLRRLRAIAEMQMRR